MIAGPRFSNPPIAELALSVQFVEVPQFRITHLASFWARIREEYPIVEEHPPLRPISEVLARPAGPRIELEIAAGIVGPRFWFLDKTGTRLVQLQKDRVGYNWRRVPSGQGYPSYASVLAKFREVVAHLEDHVRAEAGIAIEPTHCEVTYVDHIRVGGETGPRTVGDIGYLADFWTREDPIEGYGIPAEAGCFIRYPLPAGQGGPGRLSLEFLPGKRRVDGIPVLVMQTTVQLELGSRSWESVWTGMKYSQERAEDAFLKVTTGEAQRHWGRES